VNLLEKTTFFNSKEDFNFNLDGGEHIFLMIAAHFFD